MVDGTYPFNAGRNYITTLKIVDHSMHSVGDDRLEKKSTYDHSIIIVFSARFEDAPRVARVGDVIRVTKARTKIHNEVTQFHVDTSAGASWVLFSASQID